MNEKYKELIESCKNNNTKSQEQLFKIFYNSMLNICFRYSGDLDEAKNVLQDGFIKIFSKINSFDNSGSFEGWIKRIIRNNAIDYIRKNKNVMLNIDDYDIEIIDDVEITDYSKYRIDVIYKAIEKLSPAYKKTFMLYSLEDCTFKEISNIFGVSESTVKSNYYKAKLKVVEYVSNYV